MGGGVGRAEIKKLRRFNHFSFVFFVGYVQTQPGGDSDIERTEALVGHYEKKPLGVSRSCFMGVA